MLGKFSTAELHSEPSLICGSNFITVSAERIKFIPWLGSRCLEASLLVNSYFIFILYFFLE